MLRDSVLVPLLLKSQGDAIKCGTTTVVSPFAANLEAMKRTRSRDEYVKNQEIVQTNAFYPTVNPLFMLYNLFLFPEASRHLTSLPYFYVSPAHDLDIPCDYTWTSTLVLAQRCGAVRTRHVRAEPVRTQTRVPARWRRDVFSSASAPRIYAGAVRV